MKSPHAKAEVSVRVGAMSDTMPSYTIEEAERLVAEQRREMQAINRARKAKLDPEAIWDKYNKRK